VRAVEDALKIQIPTNARLIRNIIEAIQYIQDHVVHFYHLHALDWVDILSALEADPVATSELAQSISDWPKSSADYFKGVQDRLKKFAASGQLGIFANAYWGHPAYKLPPEANLMAVAHYLEALDWQREVIKAHAILGSKNPHLQTYLVGGMRMPSHPIAQRRSMPIRSLTCLICLPKPRLCREGVRARWAGGGAFLPGLGRPWRGAGELHVLRRFSAN
jgi:Ni,Fe-hydrogenase I large subunit